MRVWRPALICTVRTDITNVSEFTSSASVGAYGGKILLGRSECPDLENVHSCEADGGVQRLTVRG